MKIHFKNGDTKVIDDWIGERLKSMVAKGCGQFQCFSDNDDKLILMINLQEVNYIDDVNP